MCGSCSGRDARCPSWRLGGTPRPTFPAAKMAAVPVKAPRASTNWDSRLPGGGRGATALPCGGGTGQNEITVRMKSHGHEPRATNWDGTRFRVGRRIAA